MVGAECTPSEICENDAVWQPPRRDVALLRASGCDTTWSTHDDVDHPMWLWHIIARRIGSCRVLVQQQPFLREPCNILDSGVLLGHALALLLAFTGLADARVCSVAVGLRPLRCIGHHIGMQHVGRVLWRAVPAFGNLFILFCCTFVVFAVIGIALFCALLDSCSDQEATGRNTCLGHFIVPHSGVWAPRVWAPPPRNFDHLGHAVHMGMGGMGSTAQGTSFPTAPITVTTAVLSLLYGLAR